MIQRWPSAWRQATQLPSMTFVGVDALVEAGQALEHHAHLRPQAGEFCR
jgi:hypothetical protein